MSKQIICKTDKFGMFTWWYNKSRAYYSQNRTLILKITYGLQVSICLGNSKDI